MRIETPFSRKYRSRRNAFRSTSASRSRLVAAMNLTSTRRGRTLPRRVTSRVSMTRSSLTCVDSGISPTSSRNSVPPSAASSSPSLLLVAPVNAPFSYPNSSLSSSVSDSAAQFRHMDGPDRRGDIRWMVLAITSLPTPVSPRIKMLMVPAAAFSATA